MTVREVQTLMEQLRLVYPAVRLVDAEHTTVWDIGEDGTFQQSGCCFSLWGRDCRCENCSSLRACRGRGTVDKYEIIDNFAYHITSKYLEVEDRKLVLEIVSRFEDRNDLFLLEDAEQKRRHIVDSLTADFECVNYVDLQAPDEENALSAYRISEGLQKAVPGWKEEHCFRRKIALAAQYAVIPEDRELFLAETEIPVIVSHLETEDTCFVDFRMNIAGRIANYQMKFRADRDPNGRLAGFVLGCHSIDSEMKDSLSFIKSAIDTVDDVLPAAFWYEELNANGRIRSIRYSDEMRAMLGYTRDEFPDTLETLVEHIHPEDRQRMLDAAIAAGTGKAAAYDIEYRIRKADGRYMWANATGRLIRNAAGGPEGMYGAFTDISDRKMVERDREIIDVMTSEYAGVYFVDMKTGEATPYSMIESVENEIGGLFTGAMKYADAYRYCVEQLVHSEEKDRMLEIGSIGSIMKELRHKKTFRTIYRDAEGRYCEMKFVKMGDPQAMPEAVALCFSAKDEELRSKEEAARQLRRNLEIIGILASEYTSVYYIDLDTEELEPYTMNEQTENEFGRVFRAGIGYSSAFRMYVDTLVWPGDRAAMLKAGSVFTILNELSDKKSFTTRFRNAEGRYSEMKFVKVGDDQYPRAVALGFSDKDDEIRARIGEERKQKVFADLLSDAACVSYIALDTDPENDVTPYRVSSLLKRLIPCWEQVHSFRRQLDLMAEHCVIPEERERFLATTNKTAVLKALESAPVHVVRFLSDTDGERHSYECTFTADKDETGKPVGVVAGFHRTDLR